MQPWAAEKRCSWAFRGERAIWAGTTSARSHLALLQTWWPGAQILLASLVSLSALETAMGVVVMHLSNALG